MTRTTVTIADSHPQRHDELFSPAARDLLAGLARELGATRSSLLRQRAIRQDELSRGGALDFRPDTADLRADGTWRVAPPAPGLVDRRVEITGPTDRRMTINALNSGAKVWLADFEDANSPSWDNMVGGQLNLIDALDRRIDFDTPEGRRYELRPDEELPTIVVRPRGWHLTEKHVLVDGEPMSASLFDFGLYLVHCARRQLDRGKGPYFYLPKLESAAEARLWHEAFVLGERELGLPAGTIRATVLIETIPAAFEMDEILYELREHSSGLNAGRWDYLFSIIKKFRDRGAGFVLPDRNSVTMTAPFMRAYSDLLVRTCHRRGAHAIGGMAAFIPSRRDEQVNAVALAKVRQDKTREADAGYDGSWVAHPDLVPVCRAVFDERLGARPHQLDRRRDDVDVRAGDLATFTVESGTITLDGLRTNVGVALRYLRAWLDGNGAVAIANLMEDTATAEISRSQIWQWVRHGVTLDTGQVVTRDLVREILDDERARLDDPDAYAAAHALFAEVALADEFVEFLTLPAYARFP
jgi:malate synthase